jgi:hypothetical protein
MMAKEKEQLTQTLGIKITPTMDTSLKRIADEIYPGEHNAYSMFIRRIMARAIADHDQAKETGRDRDSKIATKRDRRMGR